jgi:hypothetical protein
MQEGQHSEAVQIDDGELAAGESLQTGAPRRQFHQCPSDSGNVDAMSHQGEAICQRTVWLISV